MADANIVVIGGGIAGASLAYFASEFATVTLLEREGHCGYHATGRSAASFTENYGTEVIRRLAMASRAFLEKPPQGFCASLILKPRGMITIAREDQLDILQKELERAVRLVPSIQPMDRAEVLKRVPIIRADYLAGAIIEPMSMEIDVDQLHQGYLTGAKSRGVKILTDVEVQAIDRRSDGWTLITNRGAFEADVVVNAAGAWGDVIARMAGLAPLGLQPKRRTAFTIPLPADINPAGWPMVTDVDEEFYFKPDAGRLFVSPADATLSEPVDAYPDDLDVAEGVERLQRATTITVTQAPRAWAGLRTFASDGSPVVGPDTADPSFIWLVGQGGYGIKTSPALAMLATALIRGAPLPAEIAKAGVQPAQLSPSRFLESPVATAFIGVSV